jgi:hypothetical protein
MEEDIQILIGRLSGLEAARTAIEAEIADVHRRIRTLAGQLAGPAAPSPKEGASETAPHDASVLGFDALGRIKRKRNLSEEEREKRRTLIASARAKRLEKLHRATFVVSRSTLEVPAATTTETKAGEQGQRLRN